MVNIRKSFLSLLAIASIAVPYSYLVLSSPKVVTEGHIGYTRGKSIESSGFYWCSAVVLDSGDSAIYAHCLPTHESETIEKMIDLANVRDIDLSKSFVVINAGLKSSLNIFSNSFAERGIEVRLANMYFCQEKDDLLPRKVSYFPVENRLDLSKGPQRKSFSLN
jgi:hypothetical protein